MMSAFGGGRHRVGGRIRGFWIVGARPMVASPLFAFGDGIELRSLGGGRRPGDSWLPDPGIQTRSARRVVEDDRKSNSRSFTLFRMASNNKGNRNSNSQSECWGRLMVGVLGCGEIHFASSRLLAEF